MIAALTSSTRSAFRTFPARIVIASIRVGLLLVMRDADASTALSRPWFLPRGYRLSPGFGNEGELWRLVISIALTVAIATVAPQASEPETPAARFSAATGTRRAACSP